MGRPVEITEQMINGIAEKAARRLGLTAEMIKKFIEETTPEELILQGVLASLEGDEKGRR